MVNQRTLLLCPSCSCHARREERECPHCGTSLTRDAGTTTQRSVTAVAMGLALAVASPVAGCGEDASGSTSGNGGGQGGARPSSAGNGGATSADDGDDSSNTSYSSASLNSITSSYGAPASVGQGGGEDGACVGEPFFADRACDECAQASCCPEMDACWADPWSCMNREGFLDPESELGGPLLGCLEAQCGEECGFDGGICGSGITIGDDETATCLAESCCAEFLACSMDGTNVQPCLECFEAGGGTLCQAALTCMEESCAT